MIKLFVSDLDGTLFNRFHCSDRTILNTIDLINANDKYFAIATGRNMRQWQRSWAFKNRRIYSICMNGALILDDQERIIYQKQIDSQVLKELLETFPELNFECIDSKHTYLRCSKAAYLKQKRSFKSKLVLLVQALLRPFFKTCLFDCSDRLIVNQPILKVNCRLVKASQKEKLNDFLIKHQDKLINAPFSRGIYEITDIAVNKGNAVNLIAQLLKIKDDEVAVYGNGGNDIQMLARFKHSYVPANASKEAKAAASVVIGDYKKHSVVKHMKLTIRKES